MAKTTPNSTRDFVEINDIRGPLVLMHDGSLRAIVEVESVNFDLKSQDEQIGIIRGYQDFLNSLDFPLQIVASSRKLDISKYLKLVDDLAAQTTKELMKVQLTEYSRFIKGLTELASIMRKRFYVVVPYYAVEAEVQTGKGGVLGTLKGIFKEASPHTSLTDAEVAKYQAQIDQRISIVMAGLTPLGVKAKVLEGKDLLETYYEYYNPGEELN